MYLMPRKTIWKPKYTPNDSFNSFGLSFGYNFKKSNNNLPISIGIGYIQNKFNYSEFIKNGPIGLGLFNTNDSFDCFSVGVSYDYYLLFSFGASIKTFDSVLDDIPIAGEIGSGKAESTAFDFGVMITTPVSRLFFKDYKIPIFPSTIIKPKLDFTLGYSLMNLGNKIYYIDPKQADPISRTARLGYSFNLSLFISNSWIKSLNFLEYSFTAEAENLLVSSDEFGNDQYQGLIGDIKFGKHLIELRGDNLTLVHRGHILKLFETIYLLSGRFNEKFYEVRKSNGIGFSTNGLFKLFESQASNLVIKYILRHLTIEFYKANIFADTEFETKMSSSTISFRL